MIYRNQVKKAIQDTGLALGAFIQIASPENAELAAASGFDFIILDMEHGSFGIDSLVGLIRAVQVGGATPVVRLPDDSETGILKALDAGAVGVMIPLVSNPEQVRKIVNASYYAPLGTRGACPRTRATAHGLHDFTHHIEWYNQNVMVWIIIETREGFRNFEKIITIPGLYGVSLGQIDLAVDMGYGSQFNHPEVEEQMLKAMAIARKNNRVEIIMNLLETLPKEMKGEAQRWVGLGSRILICGTDRKCLNIKFREFFSNVASVRQEIDATLT